MTIKQQYNKILEGCGKQTYQSQDGYDDKEFCSEEHLCPSCKAKKEVFLERCKDELEFLEMIKNYRFRCGFLEGELCNIFGENGELNERISQLKEVLEILRK